MRKPKPGMNKAFGEEPNPGVTADPSLLGKGEDMRKTRTERKAFS